MPWFASAKPKGYDYHPWLDRLIELQGAGFSEVPGPGNNPTIMRWGAKYYPAMDDDSTTPWCGIGAAGVMDDVGHPEVVPPGPAAAISWLQCGEPCEPRPGAVVVFPRAGGNHVTFIREVDGWEAKCIGCNQSSREGGAITTTTYDLRDARGCRWPIRGVALRLDAETPKKAPKVDTPVDSRSFVALEQSIGEQLKRAVVRPEYQGAIDRAARLIAANKGRYRAIQKATGVPWAWIGAVHMRESSCNFDGVLHNGEKIIGTGEVTSLVPSGRGPFDTWEEAAIDALKLKGLEKVKDWSPERVAYEAERFNGFGYRGRHASPYVWSGTNLYNRGKYTSDGNYDASHKDAQLGVWPLYLRALDVAGDYSLRRRSSKIRLLDRVRSGAKWLGSTILTLFSLENLTSIKEWLGVGMSLVDPKVLVVTILGVGLVWILVNALDTKIVDDHKEGRYEPSGPDEEEPK